MAPHILRVNRLGIHCSGPAFRKKIPGPGKSGGPHIGPDVDLEYDLKILIRDFSPNHDHGKVMLEVKETLIREHAQHQVNLSFAHQMAGVMSLEQGKSSRNPLRVI